MSNVERNQLFQELKTELFKRQLSNSESFDKAILTYASGALALSLAFLKDFVPIATSHYSFLLYFSWFSFAICIAVTVASYLVSQQGIKRQLELAERYYLKKDEAALTENNFAAACTDYLNITSGVLFCTAVLLTTLFIAFNAKDVKMTGKDRLTEAAPIPSIQKVVGNSDVQKGAPIPKITPVSPPPPPKAPPPPPPSKK